jgi:hypothetical protein
MGYNYISIPHLCTGEGNLTNENDLPPSGEDICNNVASTAVFVMNINVHEMPLFNCHQYWKLQLLSCNIY